MSKRRKYLVNCGLILMAIAPIAIYAYEYGPDPGYSGAPGDNPTGCIASGCHTGTVNSFAGGSTTITASGGTKYIPGQTQTIKVTITDSSEKKYGFQLTARVDTNPTTTGAGLMLPTDALTQVLCSDGSMSPATGCPSRLGSLQWIEHALAGYNASGTPPSYTYSFNWTPPATNVGTVTLYVAGNAVTGTLSAAGTHVYLNKLQLSPTTATLLPTTTTLTSSPNPSTVGQSVTLTATMVPTTATGSITFKDGSTTLGSATLSGGTATLAVTTFTAGAHSLTALYSGDPTYSTSTSAALTQTVNQVVSPGPSINPAGVVALSSAVTTIQPGAWFSIYGTNLATGSTATLWDGSFPTTLGGTSVTVNGKSAYLYYVAAGQINAQAPDDTATGTVPVVVTTSAGNTSSTVTLASVSPSFMLLDNKHVTGIIIRSDGSGAYGGGVYDIVGPTGTSLGYKTVAAKAGDSLVLFGVGFGPTTPAVPSGKPFAGGLAPTNNKVQLTINGLTVTPSYSGIAGAGYYQFNLTVPAGLGTGDQPLTGLVAGAQTQPGVVLSLQ